MVLTLWCSQLQNCIIEMNLQQPYQIYTNLMRRSHIFIKLVKFMRKWVSAHSPLPRCKNWAPVCSSSELGLCRSTAVQFHSPPLCLLLFCLPRTTLAICTWIEIVVFGPYHTTPLRLIPSIVGSQIDTLSLL